MINKIVQIVCDCCGTTKDFHDMDEEQAINVVLSEDDPWWLENVPDDNHYCPKCKYKMAEKFGIDY